MFRERKNGALCFGTLFCSIKKKNMLKRIMEVHSVYVNDNENVYVEATHKLLLTLYPNLAQNGGETAIILMIVNVLIR